jgi:ATP-dependent Clp protease ATP-binding subunit ClpX
LISNCSFCGKSQADVRLLIAGRGDVVICNECLDMCQRVIDQNAGWAGPPPPLGRQCSFCGRPNDAVRHLVAGPRDASICNNCVASSRRVTASV